MPYIISKLLIVFCLAFPISAAFHAGQNLNRLESDDQDRLHTKQTLEQLATANPMRKIISMLQDMQKELEREAENEAAIFEKAMCACEGGGKELSDVIAESSASIDSLSAKVKEETAEKQSLAQELADHYSSKDG